SAAPPEHLLPAALADQVALPPPLDADSSKAIPGAVASPLEARQRVGVHLAHVTQQVRAQLSVRIVPNSHWRDLHPWKIALVGLTGRDSVSRDIHLPQGLLIAPGAVARLRDPLRELLRLRLGQTHQIDDPRPSLFHVDNRRN